MLNLEPITLEMLRSYKLISAKTDVRLCDYAPGCITIWGRYFDMHGCIKDGMFFSILRLANGNYAYALPIGVGSLDAALSEIEKDATERGLPLKFCCIPEEYISRLFRRFGEPSYVGYDCTWSDYLYPYENFCGYNGKALHGQRNHVNRFMREHPNYRFISMTDENTSLAREFMLINRPFFDKDEELAEAELTNLGYIFDSFEALGLQGGLLTDNNRTLGFTIGEPIGDTLHIHVEKALTEFPGSYQMLAMCYAQYMKSDKLCYINRQDDAGDEGLRKSKRDYKPCRMLDKYHIHFCTR